MGTDTPNNEFVFFHFLFAIIHCVFPEFNLEPLREGEALCRAVLALNFGHISTKRHKYRASKHTSLTASWESQMNRF